MNTQFIATGWRSASSKQVKGVTFGIRFGVAGRDLVEGRPSTVALHLAGGHVIQAPVTPGFWKHCPEIRHRDVGPWMASQGITLPWPINKPPQFTVRKLGTNIFEITTA